MTETTTERHTKGGFWDTPREALLRQLDSNTQGLTSAEAARRQARFGANSLSAESRYASLWAFLRMFANPLVLILIGASIVSLVTGGYVEGGIILVIVMVSVILNYVQEFQARHAVEKLRMQ
jgi:P-type Mg2+ transporter